MKDSTAILMCALILLFVSAFGVLIGKPLLICGMMCIGGVGLMCIGFAALADNQ
jgi:hypothetical protein